MSERKKTICLSMIVKNEAPIIRRCLDSVRPITDHWIIVDTGSTDGTQEVIRAALADIPGTLVERPWVDFAFNRTEALELARAQADYSLIIDADDELIIPDDFVMPKLTAAGYTFTIFDGPVQYTRKQLVANTRDWRYAGVIHEVLYCHGPVETPVLPLAMRRGHEGARRRDPETAQRDIAVLETALSQETNPFLIARYTFYLACYYKAAERRAEALDLFLTRTALGHGDEEVYASLLYAAELMEQLQRPEDAIIAIYERAMRVVPARAEAYHGASRSCRRSERFAAGFRYAQAALPLAIPETGIDLQPWIYAYGVREEFSVHASQVGQHRVCLWACLEILSQPGVPSDVLSRTADLARQALADMVDPAWGCQPTGYRSEFLPAWQT
jgi:glycosyltransferase involved in cell wall biosynthesis